MNHRRWLTTSENIETARACLALLRAEGSMSAILTDLRSINRCPVVQVKAERIQALRASALAATQALAEAEAIRGTAACQWRSQMARKIRLQLAVVENASGETLVSPKCDCATGSAGDNRGKGWTWRNIVAESEEAARCWPTRVSARSLALRVVKHAVRVEATTIGEHVASRVGAVGTYSAFEVRALLLSIVGDAVTRRNARRALRSLGSSPSIEALRAGMGDARVEARLMAALGLGLVGGRQAVEALVRAVERDPEAGVRELAFWSLTLTSPEVASSLLHEFGDSLHEVGRTRVHNWLKQRARRGPTSWAV